MYIFKQQYLIFIISQFARVFRYSLSLSYKLETHATFPIFILALTLRYMHTIVTFCLHI
jgi:hypothetical protein